MRRACVLAGWVLIAMHASACSGPSFDPPSIIKTERVLGIVADPPEVRPGAPIRFTALMVTDDGSVIEDPATHGLRVEWRACLRDDASFAFRGAQYDPAESTEGCDPMLSLDLTLDGPRSAVASGEQTQEVWDRIGALTRLAGNAIPERILEIVTERIGIPLAVELRISRDDEIILRAIKRFMLSERDVQGTNPPPPRLTVNGTWVSARGGTPDDLFVCVPEQGADPEVEVPPAETIVLAPEPGDQRWFETYPVLDINGDLSTNTENGYYAWFSTKGSFEEEETQSPIPEEKWTTPSELGTYPLFVVVRDGHGGTSACKVTVRVAR